jgi:hypothetical protein
MSGFEVVGVILGVLPLVISGLEDYSDGVDTLTQMLKYKAVVDDLLTTFLMLQAIYHNSCRALLEPLILYRRQGMGRQRARSSTGEAAWQSFLWPLSTGSATAPVQHRTLQNQTELR